MIIHSQLVIDMAADHRRDLLQQAAQYQSGSPFEDLALPTFAQLLLLLFLFVLLLLTGCAFLVTQGSGNIVSVNRAVEGFTRVQICCGMVLRLTQGPSTQLTLEGDDNLLPEVETVVHDGTLTIRFRRNLRTLNFRTSQPITLHLTMPTVQGISVSGGGTLAAETLASDTLRLAFSGGSQADIKAVATKQFKLQGQGGDQIMITTVDAETATVTLLGGSQVKLRGGTIHTQEVSAKGGSDYDAAAVQGAAATITISGGGEAALWADDRLTVNATGGSTVVYRGNPTLRQTVTGGSVLQPFVGP